mmetsp:Transcript_4382/g.8707  ORF Transcript_4382/g.8707 Transcript_4382/m.8707 type:complete len:419 (+) Transcript_4382:173-1429(+)|eukprot:CAMPEP_0118809040 /NCGR_PEP_ID=MMETSP1161-20130426/36287_1 /TAXON_ID=249345 /ORGANISM="Picochlorum oklahomensis, Strain CCMP2329" /LENGTH=418 /DNA_ID=CAMNT_0006738435 /DNA_START=167 /DNA_END=1423 /DNA_ORIENTATION=+
MDNIHPKIESSDTEPRKDDFVISGPFRLVKPYHFDFVCSVKQRWAGQTIIDIFEKEFKGRNRAYYENAFKVGKLRVEGPKKKKGRVVTADTLLNQGERMRHHVHRHEPPVPNIPIQIIEANDDFVVVNKPPGIPVHSAGQYRKNTVHGILQAEHGHLMPMAPSHRLDKPVSGILVFSRNRNAAERIRKAMASGETTKVYVARVSGRFEKDVLVDAPMCFDYTLAKAIVRDNDERDMTSSRKRRHEDDDDEKEEGKKNDPKGDSIFRSAKTVVRLLAHAPDGKTSLVECQPITGRTHQIRAHLSHIGFPIANDVTYGGTWGGYTSTVDLAKSLGITRNLDNPEHTKKTIIHGSEALDVNDIVPEDLRDDVCPHCPYYVARDYPVDLTPLWLHARKYSFCDQEFIAPYPTWAKDDFPSLQ